MVEEFRAKKIVVLLSRRELDGVSGIFQAPIEHALHALICNRENFQEGQEHSGMQLQ